MSFQSVPRALHCDLFTKQSTNMMQDGTLEQYTNLNWYNDRWHQQRFDFILNWINIYRAFFVIH